MSSVPENIQILIQEGYLREAFDEYLRHAASINNDKLKRRLIYLQSQLVEVENKFNLGLISFDEYDIKKNRIRLGMLESELSNNKNNTANEVIVGQVIGVLSLTLVMAGSRWSGLNIWFQYIPMILLSLMGVTAFYSIYPTVSQFKRIAAALIAIFLIAAILFHVF